MYDTTTKKGAITFKYNAEELFGSVCLLSAYMAKNIVTEAGPALDQFCITEDERQIYDECLRQTFPNIYANIMDMADCRDGAFYDGTDDPEVSISIKNNNAYNINVLGLVDATLHDCLKYGILSTFYSINTHEALYSIAKGKMEASLSQLRTRLFQLRKKPVSPQI